LRKAKNRQKEAEKAQKQQARKTSAGNQLHGFYTRLPAAGRDWHGWNPEREKEKSLGKNGGFALPRLSA